MAAPGGEENNGRITTAILGERVDKLTEAVKALTVEVKESNKCMNQLAVDGATRENRLDTAEEEIKNLRATSNRNDVLATLIAAATGALVGIFGGKQ